VAELDALFWSEKLHPMPPDEWVALQRGLVVQDRWILDGDLGPYDVLEVRLRAADTVVVLDFALWRCVWRVVRRSRERADFWRWMVAWRRRSRPQLMEMVAKFAPVADLHVARTPGSLDCIIDRDA
jgi:hypothetical protein